ncbi:TetR/AcrR family transcriptional regulator [Streptomyces bambusae]|uniref:TetR/AcrR family transcriptional regulator n=1 Tax=Streptomyces bambusae TaxID=1550616 RepID=UPI001CFCA43F|nr:TetR/AcrR family transcriptional regulator [Streptomyces bambusae]MCB5164706.1 TetR/AcrR family transcriptional regulator [Streptomyces bambusae]
MAEGEFAADLMARAVERPLAKHHAASAQEVRHLLGAAYAVIERTGSLDLTMRELLHEAGMSNQAFYRHFGSKDDLFIAILDHGRRRMAELLRERMSRADGPLAAVRAWVDGVLAQAADPRLAARTRPFVAHVDRLATRFPEAHRASERAMIEPLMDALRAATADGSLPGPGGRADPERDARTVYLLTVASLHDHLMAGTPPTPSQVDHLFAFVSGGLRGTAGSDSPADRPEQG